MTPQRKPTRLLPPQGFSRLAALWLGVLVIVACGFHLHRLHNRAVDTAMMALAEAQQCRLTTSRHIIANGDPLMALQRAPALPADGETPAPERTSLEEEQDDSDESIRSRRSRLSHGLAGHSSAFAALGATCWEPAAVCAAGEIRYVEPAPRWPRRARTAATLSTQTILGVSPARGPPSA